MKASKIASYKWLPALIFCLAIAFHILVLYYQDMLFTAHLRTPFIGGSLFFDDFVSSPFGLMKWAGCWLTQFCYYPLLGILLYLALWSLTYFFAVNALGLSDKWYPLIIIPLGCLLLSVVDLGYWIYCMTEFGYWYSHSLAYLLMFGFLFLARKTMEKENLAVYGIVLITILLYPILGWYSILLSVMLVVLEWKTLRTKSLLFLLPCLSPLLWGLLTYHNISVRDLWLGGFPVFEDGAKISLRPAVPFISLAVFSILLTFFPKKKKAEEGNISWFHVFFMYIAVPIVVFIGVEQLMFKDYNYLAEMRMSKCAMEGDWTGVLQEAQKQKAPSRSMVLLKNIALLNTGELGNLAFKFNNEGRDIKNPDGLNMSSMQIIGPVVYYNYGKINYAIRWANEFAVCYGYSPYYLMNLISTTKSKGERHLTDKYLEILHSHLFYKNWTPKPVSPLANELENAFGNVIDSDNNNMEYYLIDTFSQSYNSENSIVKELSLFNSMIYGNSERFWNAFINYASIYPERVLPQHYQEAYFIFMEIAPVELPFKIKINTGMAEAYTEFRRQYDSLSQSKYSSEEIAQALKIKWGGSYWWHYFFAKKNY